MVLQPGSLSPTSLRSRPVGVCIILLSLAAVAIHAMGETRSFDGSGNNEAHPGWGAAGARLERLSPAFYGDQVSTIAESSRPNPRKVSNVLSEQAAIMASGHQLSDMVWVWGQFLDHDISITPESESEFAAVMTASDDVLAPMIPMMRSAYDSATGTDATNPRQQTNAITAFIDGSGVYGSSAERAMRLRTGQGGRPVMTLDGMLPKNLPGIDMANPVNLPVEALHSVGDVRANENPALLAMHTLWVREHNRLAEQASSEHPDWTDEEIFQYARRFVGAEIQVITYQEFLPALIGDLAPLLSNAAYDPTLNPGILNEFSAGLYRLGHSMIPTHIAKVGPDGSMSDVPLIILRDCFFNPQCLDGPASVDAVFRGLMVKQMQEVDVLVVDDLRNFLFGVPGAGGLDLISLNIQRGRDHGLPSYNDVRASLGLAKWSKFAEIATEPRLVAGLESLYDSTDSLDLWIGAMSEPHYGEGSVGETIAAGIREQFIRLRDGDRFFFLYDDELSVDEKAALMGTTLSDVISRNTTAGTLPVDAFHAHHSMVIDSDGDGMDDLAESIAGTDPNDAGSLFKITKIERTQSGVLLEWSSMPGKLYTVEYQERVGGRWKSLGSIEAPADASVQAFTDPDPSMEGYYRVNIRR